MEEFMDNCSPTHHEKLLIATKKYTGKVLTGTNIKNIVLSSFPDTKRNCILPNDHAEGNKCPCSCANTPYSLFRRTGYSQYLVL